MALTWEQITLLLTVVKALLLTGPPGTGKSFAAIHAPRPDDAPLYVVTLTEETPAAELRGHWIPAGGGEFRWLFGAILNWWRTGGRLVLNEIDKASADAVSFLLAALDDVSVAQMTLPNGETIRPTPNVWRQVIATTNAEPRDMLAALADRLFPHVLIDTPHESAFLALPATLRTPARNAITSGKKDASASLRAWLTMAKLRHDFTQAGQPVAAATDLAARAVWGNAAMPILDAIRLANID